MRRRVGSAWVFLVAMLSTACAAAPDDEPRVSFVGLVAESDGDSSLALVVQGSHVAGYVCADDVGGEYPVWFTGELGLSDDRSVRLESDGWIFEADWNDARATGTLTSPDGEVTSWAAKAPREGALTGLYGSDDDGCMTGVIVIERGAGSPPVVRGAWCNAEGAVAQVTPVMPLTLHDDRLAVQVELSSGPRRLEVAPLALPFR